MSKILIIFHNNCYDGVTAAWVAWKYFGDGAQYIAANYSDSPPDVKDRDVVIVDFSWKRDVILKMKEDAKSLLILDHHKTAEKELEGLDYAIFDMDRSGAGLAWDFYHGDGLMLKGPAPNRHPLVNYVEDRDLWRYNLYGSREVNAFIQSFDINLETWIRDVEPIFEKTDIMDIMNMGMSLLRQQSKLVRQICEHAQIRSLPGKNIAGIYVQTSILMSEVCEQMLKDYPECQFAFYSFARKDGKVQYGLRSRGDFDVSIIAQMFGGGGHKSAAGFEL